MTRILLQNALIVTMDPARRVIDGGAIVVDGRLIAGIFPAGVAPVPEPEDEIVDLRGYIVIPGLINTHVHTSQHLARGLGDDADLLTWLYRRILPYESAMTVEDSYTSALLCCCELIRSGVTAFAEAGGQHVDGMGRAVGEAGLRAILAKSVMDFGDEVPPRLREPADEAIAIQENNVRRWNGRADGRIRAGFGLRQILNNSPELIEKTKAAADRLGVGIHMHVAEIPYEHEFTRAHYGGTTVSFLASIGALGPNLLAAHSVWVDDQDIHNLARTATPVSHCPAAAMRVLGFARIPEMIAAGVTVGIGTDGAPSNNRMSMVDEMYLTFLVHKGRLLDPTVMPAQKVLEMATIDGAKALQWETDIGSLEAGKRADLVVIDPRTPNMLPLHDPVANLVSSMKSENVHSVMCDGAWLMRDRRLLTLDEPAILAEAGRRAADLRARAQITLPARFPVLTAAT